MSLSPQELADWDVALSAAQHHVTLMPPVVVREKDTSTHEDVSVAGVGMGSTGADGRSLFNGAMLSRKKPGRKPKDLVLNTPEAKRARALDSMVSAAERSNALQKGAAEAGAEHLRRLELADAEV